MRGVATIGDSSQEALTSMEECAGEMEMLVLGGLPQVK